MSCTLRTCIVLAVGIMTFATCSQTVTNGLQVGDRVPPQRRSLQRSRYVRAIQGDNLTTTGDTAETGLPTSYQENSTESQNIEVGEDLKEIDCGLDSDLVYQAEELDPSSARLITSDQIETLDRYATQLKAGNQDFRSVGDVYDSEYGPGLVVELSRATLSTSISEQDVGKCLASLVTGVRSNAFNRQRSPREMYFAVRKRVKNQNRNTLMLSGYFYLTGRTSPPDSLFPISNLGQGVEVTLMSPPRAKRLTPSYLTYAAVRNLKYAVEDAQRRRGDPDPYERFMVWTQLDKGKAILTAQLMLEDGDEGTRWQALLNCLNVQTLAFGIKDGGRRRWAYEGVWTCSRPGSHVVVATGSFRMEGSSPAPYRVAQNETVESYRS